MIYHRKYQTHEDYKKVQGHKALNHTEYIKAGEAKRKRSFHNQFGILKEYFTPGNVLCLGARTGCEVQVLQELGFTGSVGIDLYPLSDSVIAGDWSNLPFEDNSFSNVFTNALDHCADFERLIAEVKRVLCIGGIFSFITDAVYSFNNNNENFKLVQNENLHELNAMFWDGVEDLIYKVVQHGLGLLCFHVVKGKEYICLRRMS